jgi:uncharacterized protein (DUF433 family)
MSKREIKAKNILEDLRAGLTDDQLMEKYRLSPTGLKSLFDKMVAAKVMTKEEYAWRPVGWDDTVSIDLSEIKD